MQSDLVGGIEIPTKVRGLKVSMARQLYELQEFDLEIEAKRETLEQIEEQLGDSEALVEMKANLARQEEQLARLVGEQRALEWQVDDLSEKIALEEDKLYGGSVRNPKELSDLQQEVEHLKQRRRELEDRMLDIMSEIETTEAKITAQSGQIQEMEQKWQEEQDSLQAEKSRLLSELTTLDEKRRATVAQIDPDSLDLYERLIQTRQGRAVAKVEQGMCQGCRISLPMTELQQARGGQQLVQCGSCGRILYIS